MNISAVDLDVYPVRKTLATGLVGLERGVAKLTTTVVVALLREANSELEMFYPL